MMCWQPQVSNSGALSFLGAFPGKVYPQMACALV